MVNNQKDLSTSEVAAHLDLPESTVRYYAQEFDNFLQIPRNKAGYRIFNSEHVEMLNKIKKMLKDEGLSIKQVHQRLAYPGGVNNQLSTYPAVVSVTQNNSAFEEFMTTLDAKNAQRINDLEQAILMLAPLLRQIREEHASKLDLQQKEMEKVLEEMKLLQKKIAQHHNNQTMTVEESIRRTDELISAWREQQKANLEVAAAVEKLQSSNSKGFLARLFGL